jgi:hypothetical protein
MTKRHILIHPTVVDAMVRILLPMRKNQAVAILAMKLGRRTPLPHGLSGVERTSSNASANIMERDWMRSGERDVG